MPRGIWPKCTTRRSRCPPSCLTAPVWHIFAVRCADRTALEKHLNARGIGTNKHYPTPIHLQGAYAELGLGRGALPLAEEISATELSLPMFYGMTDAQVQAVIDAVNEFEGEPCRRSVS